MADKKLNEEYWAAQPNVDDSREALSLTDPDIHDIVVPTTDDISKATEPQVRLQDSINSNHPDGLYMRLADGNYLYQGAC